MAEGGQMIRRDAARRGSWILLDAYAAATAYRKRLCVTWLPRCLHRLCLLSLSGCDWLRCRRLRGGRRLRVCPCALRCGRPSDDATRLGRLDCKLLRPAAHTLRHSYQRRMPRGRCIFLTTTTVSGGLLRLCELLIGRLRIVDAVAGSAESRLANGSDWSVRL